MQTTILICLALAVPALSQTTAASPNPKGMDPLELIKYYGYQGSVITVDTLDGYQLNLYRIPKGRNDNSKATRPVVLLLHGFETSAADWLITEKSAAYVFADGGFDVYIGSFRGSQYGRAHKTLSPTTTLFWQFSFDEMAKFDLPAMVDIALKTSNAGQLYLVAHSTGTTAAFAALSLATSTLGKKVKQFHAIAPLLTMSNVQGPLKFLTPMMKSMTSASALFGVNELKPDPELQRSWARYVCADAKKDLTCKNALLMISGAHTGQVDESRMDLINGHSPGGASVRTAVHFAQLVGQLGSGGSIQAYDFGHPTLNSAHYGSPRPPVYNVREITTPIYLYSSECDWISEPLDVQNIASMFPTTKLVFNTIVPSFNHMDFIWGNRAATEVYGPILVAMAQDLQAGTPKP